ncbi:MAG: prepilin-type N-terminal cleavage/methylation domain-containing protein [Proteobacteria bacterium]|nr:prepilin-type N-terminal cleavage/methylation domain-containing protein [Pseudomonadota bacterium]MBU4472496.1 prepilin-type N-terminal cleavage/methylation domain-containing protein [Pseudomonadota bacterium]MCG2751322.1 prepilin-type N-terminal cleavage/methylation domain-containing protein [Desulfobacteraceae bacterium]
MIVKHQTRDNKRGFTVLEVVVAATILSMGLIGTATLMIHSINRNKNSGEMALATTMAQKKMEEIRQMAYHGLGSEGSLSIEAFHTIPDNPFFQREVSVSSIPGVPGVKAVTVNVSWKAPYPQSVELKTILSR